MLKDKSGLILKQLGWQASTLTDTLPTIAKSSRCVHVLSSDLYTDPLVFLVYSVISCFKDYYVC